MRPFMAVPGVHPDVWWPFRVFADKGLGTSPGLRAARRDQGNLDWVQIDADTVRA